jgi:hypothetical protein
MLINVTRLNPLQRGYLLGFRRARQKARTEMRALLDAELLALRHELHEIVVEVQREQLAVDAAVIERGRYPDMLLH